MLPIGAVQHEWPSQKLFPEDESRVILRRCTPLPARRRYIKLMAPSVRPGSQGSPHLRSLKAILFYIYLFGLSLITSFAKSVTVLNLCCFPQQITTYFTFHRSQPLLRYGNHSQHSSLLTYISCPWASEYVSFILFKANATTHAWSHLFLISSESLCHQISFLLLGWTILNCCLGHLAMVEHWQFHMVQTNIALFFPSVNLSSPQPKTITKKILQQVRVTSP